MESSNTSPSSTARTVAARRPGGQQAHLTERFASLHRSQHPARHRCPGVPPQRRTARAAPRRTPPPVTATEDGLARPDTPERLIRPARSFTTSSTGRSSNAGSSSTQLGSLDAPLRFGTEHEPANDPTNPTNERTDELDLHPGSAGPARNATSSTSRILEPNPPFHSDDTKPPKIRFQKKYAVVEREDRERRSRARRRAPRPTSCLRQPGTRPELVPQVVLEELQGAWA